MGTIRTLDPDLVNHIAAGEVVERPASVLKELVENAIDSGATRIDIRIRRGGTDLVEVSDNGSGIGKDDLPHSVTAHSTSKIRTLSDLSNITSFGFRGEALASVAAVSDLTIMSRARRSPYAFVLSVRGGVRGPIRRASRDQGTTVSCEHLFQNVPARLHFMKTAQTEYRKSVDSYIPFVLSYPNIHFTFESDGRKISQYPAIEDASSGSLHPQRVKEVLTKLEILELFYEGEGTVIGGYVAHPRHKNAKVAHRYVFVNGRPVWDSGVAKSVGMGIHRFVPEGTTVPFLISITVPLSHVDVNVHPRKAEVRFANPFRVYSAVEAAVKRVYSDTLGKDVISDVRDRLRSGVGAFEGKNVRRDVGYDRQEEQNAQRFGRTPRYDVQKSIEFSRAILEESDEMPTEAIRQDTAESELLSSLDLPEHVSARQFLGRYLVAEIGDVLVIVDQHAASERIRFERLLADFDSNGIESQSLMIPVIVPVAETEALFVSEYQQVFSRLGYRLAAENGEVQIQAVPAILANGDQESLFRSMLEEMQGYEEFDAQSMDLDKKYRDSVIATMACHSSVRMNQRLSDREAGQMIQDLMKCANAYSCPHGRPIMWKLTQEEIDRHYER